MKALQYSRFGGLGEMRLDDRPVPKTGPVSVLIRVGAVSLNPVDVQLREGISQKYLDTVFPAVPGLDVAGVVVGLGADTPRFAVGDRVVAHAMRDRVSDGTLAEYVEVPTRFVSHLPDAVSLEDATTLPLAGQTALQSVRRAQLQPGSFALVLGASGAVGQFAVQLLASQGVTVVGTASAANQEFVRSLGAEPVLHEDALDARFASRFDAVFHFGGTLVAVSSVLAEDGTVVSISDRRALTEFGGHSVWLDPNASDLDELVQAVMERRLQTDIGAIYPFDQWRTAFDALEERRVRGKVVIRVADDLV
jgi:NADPH:quinone reductase-like Zn-dependent oxidoreductase